MFAFLKLPFIYPLEVCNKLSKKGFECQIYLKKIQDSTWKNLQMNNLPTIRQYIEIFSLNYLYNFTNENISLIVDNLKDANLKSQFSISIIFVFINSIFQVYLYF